MAKISIVSIDLIVQYDHGGDSIIITDTTFDSTPGKIQFVTTKRSSSIPINSVDEVIDILQDFKSKFEIVKQMTK